MVRIGIDLGGTKTEAIALDGTGKELRRKRVDTPRGDYPATLLTIGDLVRQIEAELGEPGTVGVGIPGTVVRATGLVKNANSTWLNGRPLEQDLAELLGRDVRCANDANCFAISEASDGAARDAGVVFGAILGTGCGAGLVFHNKLHNGPNGIAGEWGHIPLPWPTPAEIPGPSCYCGHSGCLETWISGTGFERDYERATGVRVTGREIVNAMRSGAPEARDAFARLQDRLARGLAAVINVLDPDVVVLGGGLSNIEEFYSGELESSIAGYTFGGSTHTPVRRNEHGDSGGVRGAAWLWPTE